MQELFDKGVVTKPPNGQREIVEYYVARARGQGGASASGEISVKDLVAIGNLVFKRTGLGPPVAAQMFLDVTERQDLKGEEKGRDLALYSLAEMWRTGLGAPFSLLPPPFSTYLVFVQEPGLRRMRPRPCRRTSSWQAEGTPLRRLVPA